jgi:hypothetical protein
VVAHLQSCSSCGKAFTNSNCHCSALGLEGTFGACMLRSGSSASASLVSNSKGAVVKERIRCTGDFFTPTLFPA